MRVTIIYNPNGKGADVLVHKAGCRDIARDLRHSTSHYTTSVNSCYEAAEDFHADFIDEGSETSEGARRHTHFYPCTDGLPEGSPNPDNIA